MPLIPHQQRVHPILNVKPALKNGSSNTLPTERKPSRISQLRSAIRLANVKNWFQQNLHNYCETTSLHGINYITRANISQNERIFWIIVVIVSIIVSIVLVIVSWMWNRETPTVTVIESSHFPTWNIPFPAVTICNFNKISKMKIMSLATKMQRPANVSMTKLLELLHITMYFSFALNFSREDFDLVDNILQQNNFTVHKLGNELAPNCMDMITKCIWKGTNARCDSLFQRINTTEGVCCSFNYFGQATNNFPAKIAYQVPKRPYRVTGCGYPTGLSVLLDTDPDDYFATYFNSFGFRLLIHDAYDFPDENAETKVVTLTRESFVRINPEATYATEDVKDMDPMVRNCLFANERRLKGMQRYSFVNCMSECRMELIFKRCGCIPVNLPNNGTYPICEAKRVYCVMKNRDIFIRALPNIATTLSMVKDTKEFPCKCMPDCESNNYPAEITMGHLNINAAHSNLLLNGSAPDALDNILLHVFFSDLMSTRYRMESFQNWLSALASFGGLLGLIMGFSIVTAFEFFYFLTFRPIFNYYSDS